METEKEAKPLDWRHPRDFDPEAYQEILMKLKPFEEKIAAIEAEISKWKAKIAQNVSNGKCSQCGKAFRRDLPYPVCDNICLWPCEYCLSPSFEGCYLCPCRDEINKLHQAWDVVFTEKGEVSSRNYRHRLATKGIYFKPPIDLPKDDSKNH